MLQSAQVLLILGRHAAARGQPVIHVVHAGDRHSGGQLREASVHSQAYAHKVPVESVAGDLTQSSRGKVVTKAEETALTRSEYLCAAEAEYLDIAEGPDLAGADLRAHRCGGIGDQQGTEIACQLFNPDHVARNTVCMNRKQCQRPLTGDRATDAINIGWPQGYTDNLVARAQAVFDRVTQANGVDYRSDIFEGQVFAPNTVHPLGGCVRGMATDGYGRVNGYDKLYVNDASLLPGYLGCNLFMSITALAERNIEGMLQGRS